MKKRISLKDIAKELNLTANTVSRALHDKEDISEKTKMEVRRVAERLGYVPDMVASSMRTSSTKTIAVLFDNLLNPYFMLMANYIHEQLDDKGYRMMIFTSTSTEAILTMDTFKQMLAHRVDGVISFLRPEVSVASFANNIHLPIFVVGREADDLKIDSIFTDDVNGGYIMGEYLYQKGYRKVGYLGGPHDIMCNVKRAEGLEKFYRKNNLSIHSLYATWDDRSIFDNLEILIQEQIEAIFCFNDSIAYSVVLYLQEHYPDYTIEVTGYDNIGSQLQLPVSITTIGTDVEQMIAICIEQLMTKIDTFEQPLFIESMPTYLVE
jgi:LacI family transcriptional regulator